MWYWAGVNKRIVEWIWRLEAWGDEIRVTDRILQVQAVLALQWRRRHQHHLLLARVGLRQSLLHQPHLNLAKSRKWRDLVLNTTSSLMWVCSSLYIIFLVFYMPTIVINVLWQPYTLWPQYFPVACWYKISSQSFCFCNWCIGVFIHTQYNLLVFFNQHFFLTNIHFD